MSSIRRFLVEFVQITILVGILLKAQMSIFTKEHVCNTPRGNFETSAI